MLYRKRAKDIYWLRVVCVVTFLFVSVNSIASDTHFPHMLQDSGDKIQDSGDKIRWGIFPDIKLGWRAYNYEADGEKVFDANVPSLRAGLSGSLNRFFSQGLKWSPLTRQPEDKLSSDMVG